ncbi:MAG: type 1 glutamine amidotransferase domain-containing protein [Paracoccus sp. (in: a-proteobacteria)]|uniref:type 1 glutamine amidotransferase domain-containing protein n=1 Tax=Paracoccus sp. TaxID=267 RepID=UPI0026E0F4B7|nr:type 1 glutamine amidotransferase domain-containing protein [Paracoccus sp. (in: a-proteobacteria)]MDO5622696.1 type 1 glutamine amidotransferase domain-containing protein [Paracoccus sp. (in: a-proteobacteria)]
MTNASDLKPVLFVVSSNNVKGATGIPTGYNLAEVTHPLEKLQKAGIKVEFASPKGGDAPLDGLEDMSDPVIAHFWADADFRHAISHTIPMDQVDPSRYSAIFFAGGHGTMWDFPDNAAIQNAIREIDAAGGIVSAVCHGPAALVNALDADGKPLVAGKRLASFTNAEEDEVQSTDVVPFLLADRLEAAGGHHVDSPNWSDNVIRDGRLITGQNPQSAAHLGEVLRDALLA